MIVSKIDIQPMGEVYDNNIVPELVVNVTLRITNHQQAIDLLGVVGKEISLMEVAKREFALLVFNKEEIK